MLSGFIYLFIVAVIAVLGIRRFYKAFKAPANDFSFGRKDLKEIGQLLIKGKYDEFEQRVSNLNSDDFSQLVDHICIGISQKYILAYSSARKNEGIAAIILGSYYSHQAWKARGHGYGNQVSQKQADLFLGYMNKAVGLLETSIGSNSQYNTEAHSRLIRVYMSLNEQTEAESHFRETIKLDKDHAWAHLHYTELIQEKWWGNNELIEPFLKQLPNDRLVKHLVTLKLIFDGIKAGGNYFGGADEDLPAIAKKYMIACDTEISGNPLDSIHKYIVYGYLYSLAVIFHDKPTEKKYKAKMEGNYTLYPFGII